MIRIVVDSTCDLSKEIMEEIKPRIIPLRVLINDKEYYDKVDLNLSEMYEYMEKGMIPQTSQPKLNIIRDTFESIIKNGDDIIYLAFSAKMSGSCQTSAMIARELEEEYPERRIKVIDSKSGSTAIGMMAMALNESINKGIEFNEVVKEAEFYADNVSHLFTLNNLHWLSKGGRLSKSKAVLGTIMNVKPILSIVDGKIINYKNIRGEKKAMKDIIQESVNISEKMNYEYIGIAHSNDLEKAQLIKSKMEEMLPDRKFILTDLGSVLTAHLGMGGVGILMMAKYK